MECYSNLHYDLLLTKEEVNTLLQCEMDYFGFVVICDYINEMHLHQFPLREFLKILSFLRNKRSAYSHFLECIFIFPFTLHSIIPTSFSDYKQGLDVFLLSLEINSMIFFLSSTNFCFLYFPRNITHSIVSFQPFGVMKCFPRVSY
jgi:hypothetical protein